MGALQDAEQFETDRAARWAETNRRAVARCRHAECLRARQLHAPPPDATDEEVEAFIDLLCRRNPMM